MVLTFLLMLMFSNGLNIRSDKSILYSRIGLLIVFYSLITTYTSYNITYLEQGIGLYGGLFEATCITHAFQIFVLLACAIILLLTAFYPRKKFVTKSLNIYYVIFSKVKQYINILNKMSEQFNILEYALIIIFAISGAMLLLSSEDFGSIYLCIELQSFSLYIISSMYRNSELSTGSALTYFLLGGLSSCFILLGIALIYSNSGLTNMDSVFAIIADLSNYSSTKEWNLNTYVFYSFLLISVGFLFKIAAAPFHWWSPDVYDGVPTTVTVFIATMGKLALLIVFIKLVHYSSNLVFTTGYSWTSSLTISCFFSLIIGTLLGLTQTRIKRLLAYSTISHIGFILLALISYSIDSEKAFLFYIYQYILTNLNAFIVIIAIGITMYLFFTSTIENDKLTEKSNSPIQLISQLKGYFSVNPTIAMCLIICMFSFVGLPPLVGFFGKQMVLTAALENHRTILAITGILTSVIGAVYYLSIIRTICFDKSDYQTSYAFNFVAISNAYSITIGILSLAISLFILFPNEIVNLSELLSNISFSEIYLNL